MSYGFNPDDIELPNYHFIGGQKVVGGGAEIAFHRPSDGRQVATFLSADAATVDRAASDAQKAFESSGWAQAAPSERAAVLKVWADLIDRDRIRLAQLEATSTTRPVLDMINRDLVRGAGAVRYFAEWADKVEGQYLAGRAGTTTLVRPEPYGVVGSIAPFNFPAINAIWKSAPALAVGNAVVLKPSELTPYSAVAIAELALEAGLPAGLFNVVLGAGETGSLLVRHPYVRKITFTGSSATGGRVMSDAALSGPKPVTLELGGKTPQLVLRDVDDLDMVAGHVAAGLTANAGQICTAGTRLIVPQEFEAPLLDRVIALAAEKVAAATWDEACTLPPIISERQAARIDAMLAETVSDGAEIVIGGSRVASRNEGAFYQPTILRNVPDSSVGFTGEFFGPVMSVYSYDDEAKGIAMANHPTYALAASVYTNDLRKANSLSQTLNAGTVWINTHGRQPDFSTPQGGFTGSGFGKEMGRAGLESFLRFKTIWQNHG
ncbi:aldehyde dehydrogenase [Aureimonas fodinaquatilis]|uniref:Aldehyde dehydrogenase n=1 Tax=Aureimonas fodinaquatilis TaxID=2565783 RepID=A0A5B0DUB1_9HYPH|nr:aldehyde dehydrogenase family protein [Aureimonas fodinaquatilis]KAA0969361.1 aldehyde dehydrogenase [Aureimonas fodinaquatilis]